MGKKKKVQKDIEEGFVEKCAALGFMLGSIIWFCIYFPKHDLYYGKMVMYMIIGLIAGGLLGELVQYFKNKK